MDTPDLILASASLIRFEHQPEDGFNLVGNLITGFFIQLVSIPASFLSKEVGISYKNPSLEIPNHFCNFLKLLSHRVLGA